MTAELDGIFQKIERRKCDILAHMETLTEDEMRRPPAPDAWSPVQVMEHIVFVEELVSGPNMALPPQNHRVQLKGRIFSLLGGVIGRMGLRVPTVPMLYPAGDLDYPAIVQRWHLARKSLRHKLTGITPETRRQPIALHPIAGPMTAKRVLDLLDVHLQYHWPSFSGARKLQTADEPVGV